MWSRRALQQIARRQAHTWLAARKSDKRLSISSAGNLTEETVGEVYASSGVQQLLHALNEHADQRKVFVQDHMSTREEQPKLQLMTELELKQTLSRVHDSATSRLRPPPLLPASSTETTTLANDEEIAGFDSANFVFTDISPGLTDHTRNVVVREPSGELRTASPAERGRVNRAYYDKPFSNVFIPKAFYEPYLSERLREEKHRHLLDWACHLVEPNDPVFVRVATTIFDHADTNGRHGLLWSSRHWPMFVFYLVVNRRAQALLMHLAEAKRVPEMAIVARLHGECLQDDRVTSARGGEKELVARYLQLAHADNAVLQAFADELLGKEPKTINDEKTKRKPRKHHD